MFRCTVCGRAVAPSRVRRDLGCPRCPDADVIDGTCERRLSGGLTRCKHHGGSLTKSKVAATERRLEEEVTRLLADRTPGPVTNPLEAFQLLLGEVLAVKEAFAERVAELQHLTVTDQLGREDVRALLAAYERALDRAGRLLVDAARLGIDERLVRLAEAHGALIAETVRVVVAGLPEPLAAWLRKSIAAQLRAQRPDSSLVTPPPFRIVIVTDPVDTEAVEAISPESPAPRQLAALRDPEPAAEPIAADHDPTPAVEPGQQREPAEPEPVAPAAESVDPDPWFGQRIDPPTATPHKLWRGPL